MDKIFETLKGLLPEDQVGALEAAVKAYLEEATAEIKKAADDEANAKLEEAYAQLQEELKTAETTAYAGYQEAWGMMQELRGRLETQNEEFQATMEEEFEKAYSFIEKEREKNESLASEMYEQYDNRLAEMKEYMTDRISAFLKFKGAEMYEQARRDVLNDPRMAEHKVALEKIVDITANYLSDEDFAVASSSKLEEAQKQIEGLRAEKRILEGRNVRLSTENQKLNEQVREAASIITESRQQTVVNERKERIEAGKNASGRGKVVGDEQIIAEHSEPVAAKDEDEPKSNIYKEWQTLAGVSKKS